MGIVGSKVESRTSRMTFDVRLSTQIIEVISGCGVSRIEAPGMSSSSSLVMASVSAEGAIGALRGPLHGGANRLKYLPR